MDAFIGVRSCDLHAIAHLRPRPPGRPHPDPAYARAGASASSSSRSTATTRAAPASASRWTPGLAPTFGYDLALTEVIERRRATASWSRPARERGAERARRAARHRRGERGRRRAADRARRARRRHMGRALDTTDIKDLLYRNYEHPRWDEVAERCLTCGNCTMVCPTCFCTTVEDVTDLDRRPRRALAALGLLLHDGLLATCTAAACARPAESRYRQWMTHKLGTWHRPVRQLRLCRLRPLHHLVPGRHRHHRGGRGIRADEAARRAMRDAMSDGAGRRGAGASRAWPPHHLRARSRAARERRASSRERASSARAIAADPSMRSGVASVALEIARARRAARVIMETLHDGDAARLVVAVPAATAGPSTRARSSRSRAIAFDGACLRAQVRRRPRRSATSYAAVRAGDRRPPAGDPAAPARRVRDDRA